VCVGHSSRGRKKEKKKRLLFLLLLLLLMVVMAAASGASAYVLDLFSKWRESCSSSNSDHEVALGWLLLSGGRVKLLVL
jgi:flagellar basal body-associated protein FliL